MREIKFRGKTADGKWLYGSLINLKSGPSILTETTDDEADQYPVLSETVGQSIGLKDKNGKEIFEGDYISYENEIYEIIEFAGAFLGSRNETDKRGRRASVWIDFFSNQIDRDVLVIGNIHENSELMRPKYA